MRVEVVTIGDELLLGFTVDTNAADLSRALAAEGIEVVRRSSVGDDAQAIAAAVGDALRRTGGVITTGGLGPTSDDATKPAIAGLFERAMREDPGAMEALVARWRSRGLSEPLPRSNATQAMVPEGALVLRNDHGTAPGIWLEDAEGRWVAMLPGVPREMRGMLAGALLPKLRSLRGERAPLQPIVSRTLRTTGIPESALADCIETADISLEGASLAFLPGVEGVDLRLTVRGMSVDASNALLDRQAAKLRPILGTYLYGEGDADLAAVVLDLCRGRGVRLATAESCTGGMLGGRITAVPGSSDTYLGGIVSYANEAKVALLGVDESEIAAHGAVSEPVVRAMARGAAANLHADVAIGITGVAGPSGGTPEKPSGFVWIAVTSPDRLEARSFRFFGDRDEVRRRATQAALDMVRRLLSG